MTASRTASRKAVVLTALLGLAGRAGAQEPPPVDPDPSAATISAPAEQLISPKVMLSRLASDQKRIWLFPVAAARGKGWMPALGVMGLTAGLIALDPKDTPFIQRVSFQRTPVVHGINQVLSGSTTGLAIAAVPLSFYIVGLVHKDSYASQTALLAGEAVVNAEIVTIAIKDIDRRLTPGEVGPGGDFSDTWFHSKKRSIGGFGSFPSGHTAAAFSVATVFAERYKNHRWAPWVAYGLAGVVGLSRLNAQAHFPSDVFLGAALGFSISHFAVLRR
jgi:membrane-associated PAP2 superfamily phosphatase